MEIGDNLEYWAEQQSYKRRFLTMLQFIGVPAIVLVLAVLVCMVFSLQ